MFLGGMVKPGVITTPLSFNWPRNSVIDKCCEQARKETGVCVCGGGCWPALHLWPQHIL